MDGVRVLERDADQVVYVCWERLEACLVAHEAVDVYQEEAAPLVGLVVLVRWWEERLHGSGSRVACAAATRVGAVLLDERIGRELFIVYIWVGHHVWTQGRGLLRVGAAETRRERRRVLIRGSHHVMAVGHVGCLLRLKTSESEAQICLQLP